jgi:predicted RNA-binding Zn-ribbon protein involved in translation (DUF1610 family)
MDVEASGLAQCLKVCGRCHESKPLTDFPRDRYRKDGLRRTCRDCGRAIYLQKRAYRDKRCPTCGVQISPHRSYCAKHASYQERSWKWKGGRQRDPKGYVIVTGKQGHPNARKGGQLAEHTLVMSEALGRPLLPNERVHHRNGVRDDNRIENLELWTTSQPSGQRVEDKLTWARELIEVYRPEWLQT